jgi:hypothetical protein
MNPAAGIRRYTFSPDSWSQFADPLYPPSTPQALSAERLLCSLAAVDKAAPIFTDDQLMKLVRLGIVAKRVVSGLQQRTQPTQGADVSVDPQTRTNRLELRRLRRTGERRGRGARL